MNYQTTVPDRNNMGGFASRHYQSSHLPDDFVVSEMLVHCPDSLTGNSADNFAVYHHTSYRTGYKCATTKNQCCGTDNQCSKTKNQCSGSLNHCSKSKNQYFDCENQCSGTKNQCFGAENQCSGTLNQCCKTKNQCSGSLNQCSKSKVQCSNALNPCPIALNQSSVTLNRFSASPGSSFLLCKYAEINKVCQYAYAIMSALISDCQEDRMSYSGLTLWTIVSDTENGVAALTQNINFTALAGSTYTRKTCLVNDQVYRSANHFNYSFLFLPL